MREHAPSGWRSAAPPERAGAPRRLPSAVGNRAMGRILQRAGISDAVSSLGDGLFEFALWDRFVEINRAQADYADIAPEWRQLAGEYSVAFPEDGKWIGAGVRRRPSFHLGGGLIGRAGAETHAITLDRDVFFNPDARDPREPSVDTYVHELVHVAQYGILGITGFLGSYLGEYAKHFIEGGGDDYKAYHDIVHERAASEIEERFKAWRTEREREAASRPRTPAPLEEAQAAMRPRPVALGRLAISASVGADGTNRPDDVRRIAARLHALGFLASETADAETVTAAIERYQSDVLGRRSPDGRVDPGGRTLAALSAGRKALGMRLP
jgi:Domain of unknown function (DUF4157)